MVDHHDLAIVWVPGTASGQAVLRPRGLSPGEDDALVALHATRIEDRSSRFSFLC
jgi:hypothetical protein